MTAQTQTKSASKAGNGGVQIPDFSKAATEVTTAWFDGSRQWWGDRARFMAERLESDRDVLARLSECKTFADLANVQQEWAGKAAEAYTQEARRIMEMALAGASFIPPTGEAANR